MSESDWEPQGRPAALHLRHSIFPAALIVERGAPIALLSHCHRAPCPALPAPPRNTETRLSNPALLRERLLSGLIPPNQACTPAARC